MKTHIARGYIIKARVIMDSEISIAPPYVREIFDWLILNANHTDAKVSGLIIQRGQRLTSYQEILDGLAWMQGFIRKTYSKDQCDKAMRWLRSRQMIATRKTIRGVIVTITNYDRYQSPGNYESGNEGGNGAAMERQGAVTINKNEKQKKNIYTSDFLQWWESYPRKVGKRKAFESWQNIEDMPPLDEMLVKLKAQILQPQWQKDGGHYIPHPATYLNQARWEDELPVEPKRMLAL